MPKSKRFQSGREIFQEYIPGYEEDAEEDDIECQSQELIEVILNDFGQKVERVSNRLTNRNA